MDELFFFNRALEEREIEALYQQHASLLLGGLDPAFWLNVGDGVKNLGHDRRKHLVHLLQLILIYNTVIGLELRIWN